MKKLIAGLMTATALTVAAPAFAAEIIVVAHGQANDPF
jgi:simple sugar transport system substrate-binding protein